MEYHVGDTFVTTWGNARANFYAMTGTPTTWFDGLSKCEGAYTNDTAQYNWYLSEYNARRAVPTDVTITVTGEQVSGPSFTIRTRVALEAGGTAKTVRVYMVQTLDHYPSSPDYSRATFRQAAATQDIALTPGQWQMIERTITFDSASWGQSSDIKIVVWAQQPLASAPAQVYQAAVMGWPFAPDCNGNGVPDATDIANGVLPDLNGDGVPDGCETPAMITGQPSNQAVCVGEFASFSVSAEGSPAPTFQWRKGTSPLANGGNISGATSATLTINPVGSGDAATDYNCVATNSVGSDTSNNVALTATSNFVTITDQPSSLIACLGGIAHFSVTADGCPAPTYQWRKGATNLINGGSISGATTATLTISPVASGDAASDYNCVVTNYAGSPVSNNAALATNGVAATITGQPSSQSACLGGAASFHVTATGYPAPTYQWRKGAVNLVDGGNISGATTATLTIDPAGPGDLNTYGYDVVVSNPCNTVGSFLVNLSLNYGPSISTHPQTQTGHIGATATFSVSATGAGTLHYQWRKGGSNLTNGGSIAGATTAALLINPAARTDAGTYDVVVTDDCSSVNSNTATLWLAGDVNCDGVISFADINPFVLAMQGPDSYHAVYPNCNYLSADINADGFVSFADINPFVAVLAGH